jgi:hypothetical protein
LLVAGELESGGVWRVSAITVAGVWATLTVSLSIVPVIEALQASTRSKVAPHRMGLLEKSAPGFTLPLL